jgi:hypothetical protein
MNSYELSRSWFDFCFENPEKIKPSHTAVYFFAIEHCNRLGWKDKFGFPTSMVMEAVGIKSYNTYTKTLNDLVSFGFIKMVEKSKNQYSANIIALSKFDKAQYKALDKALVKHSTKQSESTVQSTDSIDKQYNNITINNKQYNRLEAFNEFWKVYDYGVAKRKCQSKWNDLTNDEIIVIFDHVKEYVASTPDKKFRKKPHNYLKEEVYLDEVAKDKPIKETPMTGQSLKNHVLG